MTTPIDPHSARFIAWAGARLQDPAFYQSFLRDCQEQVATYFANAAPHIQARLLAKLEQGAREHGAASFSAKNIDEELSQEYLDILGWSLIRLFINEESA